MEAVLRLCDYFLNAERGSFFRQQDLTFINITLRVHPDSRCCLGLTRVRVLIILGVASAEINDIANFLLHIFDGVSKLAKVVMPIGRMCIEYFILLIAYITQLAFEVYTDFIEVLLDFLPRGPSETGIVYNDELRDTHTNLLKVVTASFEVFHLCEHIIFRFGQLLPVKFFCGDILLLVFQRICFIKLFNCFFSL
jgi:hypothetical protein